MSNGASGRGARGRRFVLVGAGVLVFTGLLHMLSYFVEQPPPANDDQATLLRLMRSAEFEAFGTRYTMWGVVEGFGLFFSAALLCIAALDVAVAGGRGAPASIVRRVAWVNVVFLLAATAISAARFPAPPTVLLGTALVLFVAAGVRSTVGGAVDAGMERA